jgi:hypothetical protein
MVHVVTRPLPLVQTAQYGQSWMLKSQAMRIMLVILFALAFQLAPLRAEMTVKFYRESINSQNKDIVRSTMIYLKGLGDGIVWANAAAEQYSKTRLFCQPGKLAFNVENYRDIVDRQITDLARTMLPNSLDDTALALVLVTGLRTTFPCGNQK